MVIVEIIITWDMTPRSYYPESCVWKLRTKLLPRVVNNKTWWQQYKNANTRRGKSPNMGRCIISYQEVLSSLLKNVNHQADEFVFCNNYINGQLPRISVLTERLCFGALWNFRLSLNCDSWGVEGKLFFWISLFLSSLLSVNLNTCFGSLVEF